jgi:hypothetical protein
LGHVPFPLQKLVGSWTRHCATSHYYNPYFKCMSMP